MVDQGGLRPDVCARGSDASDGFLFVEVTVQPRYVLPLGNIEA